MVARGYETARDSSREAAAIVQHFGRHSDQKPLTKAELRRLADSAKSSGVPITVLPAVPPPPPKPVKFKRPKRWRRRVSE